MAEFSCTVMHDNASQFIIGIFLFVKGVLLEV